MHRTRLYAALIALALTPLGFGCGDDANDPAQDATVAESDAGGAIETDAGEEEPARRVGFEILQILGPNEIVVWLGRDVTREDFDAIELPMGWFKNQPRETEPDSGSFARSPDAAADGDFTDAEHFGQSWRHNATVIEANTALDPDGLLRLNRIAKFHEVGFDAGRTLYVLVSPDGEQYVRISRDADRTSDDPTLPEGWSLVERTFDEALVFDLPNPTMNIRCDNEDSFQGPVTELGTL